MNWQVTVDFCCVSSVADKIMVWPGWWKNCGQPIAMRVIQTLLKLDLRWAEVCNRIADRRVLEDENVLTVSIKC